MRYFIDTEFAEHPNTISLISIGIVCEDGRMFYAENSEFNPDDANDWVKANVLPKLRGGDFRMTAKQISTCIRAMVGSDKPEFWGYYDAGKAPKQTPLKSAKVAPDQRGMTPQKGRAWQLRRFF